MQDIQNPNEEVQLAWRLREEKSYAFNAWVWKDNPLPIRIWCDQCLGVTAINKVHYVFPNEPIECSGFCQNCGRRIKSTVVFKQTDGQHEPAQALPILSRMHRWAKNLFSPETPVSQMVVPVRTAFLRGWVERPTVRVSPDPIVVNDGDVLHWDSRGLPDRKEVTIRCSNPECKGEGCTPVFTVFGNYSAYKAEEDAMKSEGRLGLGFMRLLTLHGYLQGRCRKCGKQIEATIRLDY